jgi:hypothetical protein
VSIGDLHNPKAAAELIEAFRRRFSSKTCMAPHSDHEGAIVAAHTLSVESMLRKIAINGHVYTVASTKGLGANNLPIEVCRRGLRDVSVFNGFCQRHDRDLFSCIETEPFRFTRRQCFMLAYRAAAREFYLKGKQFESIPTPAQFAAVHGTAPPPMFEEMAYLLQTGSLSGLKDAGNLKDALDTHLVTAAWDRLVTHAILFSETPTVLATAAFQPFFDMDGNQLQDFEDTEGDMSNLCFSLIPLQVGGVAIFSWLDTSNAAPRRFYESVLAQADMTTAVMHVALDNTENLAMNPAWYEGLSTDERRYLFSRIVNFEAGPDYAARRGRGEALKTLGNWGTASQASF